MYELLKFCSSRYKMGGLSEHSLLIKASGLWEQVAYYAGVYGSTTATYRCIS